jgi:hypothetical protein
MNLFLRKSLFLSLFALILGTEMTGAQIVPPTCSRSVILVSPDKPLLYHASFKVFKYNFTGLIVFKNISEQEGTRVVFLSEAGLSIAEFSFKNGNVECIRTLPMVDRKAAKNYLARVIEMVLTPSDCKKKSIQQNTDNTRVICKGKSGKHYYIYTADILHEIQYKKGLCRRSVGFCGKGIDAEKVLIQKRNKILVEMKIVENAIK